MFNARDGWDVRFGDPCGDNQSLTLIAFALRILQLKHPILGNIADTSAILNFQMKTGGKIAEILDKSLTRWEIVSAIFLEGHAFITEERIPIPTQVNLRVL